MSDDAYAFLGAATFLVAAFHDGDGREVGGQRTQKDIARCCQASFAIRTVLGFVAVFLAAGFLALAAVLDFVFLAAGFRARMVVVVVVVGAMVL